jgi:hypothetical protein
MRKQLNKMLAEQGTKRGRGRNNSELPRWLGETGTEWRNYSVNQVFGVKVKFHISGSLTCFFNLQEN